MWWLCRASGREPGDDFDKSAAEALAALTMEMVTVMGLTILLSGSWELMRSSPDYFFRATSGVTHHGLHSASPRAHRLSALYCHRC